MLIGQVRVSLRILLDPAMRLSLMTLTRTSQWSGENESLIRPCLRGKIISRYRDLFRVVLL